MPRTITTANRPEDLAVVEEPEFTALFQRASPHVLAYVRRRLDESSADWDTVNEVFIVAWRKRAVLPPSPAEQLPWLLAVAGNAVRNSNRSSARRRGLMAQAAQQQRGGDTWADPAGDAVDVVNVAMAQLSDSDRELIRLVAWEELSTTEIGLVLGVRPGSVRVRLHRARMRLEKALANPPASSLSASTYPALTRPSRRKA